MTKYLPWLLPLLCVLLLAPFTPNIDMEIERYFYVDGHFQSNGLVWFIYTFGVVPGWIIAIGSLALFGMSFIYSSLKPWRLYILLPLLTMIVGAGIIIDKSFKDHWGRPRPKQIQEFGGPQNFHPFYKPNFFNSNEPSKSFPSGHCSMGFLFFSVALVGKRLGDRRLFWLGIASALILGAFLGYARMAAGGHFFSDVFMSAAIMWWSALFCEWLLFQKLSIYFFQFKGTHETADKKTA